MSLLDKWDKRNQAALEAAGRLHKVVFGPDGSGYEIQATDAFVEASGAPPLFDLFLMVRAFIRRRGSTEWEVNVRSTGDSPHVLLTRSVPTQVEAEQLVEELSVAIQKRGIEEIAP